MSHKNSYSRNYQNYNIPRPKKTSRRVHGVDWQEFIKEIRLIKALFPPDVGLPMIWLHFLEIPPNDQDKAYRIVSNILGCKEKVLRGILSSCDTFARNITLKAPDGTVLLENGEFVGGGEDA